MKRDLVHDRSSPDAPHRDIEAVVLWTLIEAGPDGLTKLAVQEDLTSIENSPGRVAAINEALTGLRKAQLVVIDGDRVTLTSTARRAGELFSF